jgi:hypothetical protein
MGWWKRKAVPEDEAQEEDPNAGLLPADVEHLALARSESVEAAGALLDGPTVAIKPEEAAATPTPEYDAGDVDLDVLLDGEAVEPSVDHSDLNVVVLDDVSDLADPLADARVVGDLPQEIDFENAEE